MTFDNKPYFFYIDNEVSKKMILIGPKLSIHSFYCLLNSFLYSIHLLLFVLKPSVNFKVALSVQWDYNPWKEVSLLHSNQSQVIYITYFPVLSGKKISLISII